ncbi:heat shock transcription factor, X-linked member 4-like [Athalia rosae]|uniref:heat shock transcription factor, X-linked member 4-like n=1 Tax=Athalia rosae TaxID=37344 RepID=UPI0020340755|nr:heat shock transcription factor, X-linked member 4-like [Athalia rosae]
MIIQLLLFLFSMILFCFYKSDRNCQSRVLTGTYEQFLCFGVKFRRKAMYDDCVLLSMRFPQKLWRIVNECKTGAIRWSVNGGTILLDYKKFQEEYLNAEHSIFKTNNITSFIRQLNLYGFRKVTSHNRDPICNSHNPNVHEFLHENFRAHRTDLLAKVCRRTGAGKIKYCDKLRSKNLMKRDIADPKKKLQMSRLRICQFALTEALQQATRDYHRKRFWEEVIHDDSLSELNNFHKIAHSYARVIEGYQTTFDCSQDYCQAVRQLHRI